MNEAWHLRAFRRTLASLTDQEICGDAQRNLPGGLRYCIVYWNVPYAIGVPYQAYLAMVFRRDAPLNLSELDTK